MHFSAVCHLCDHLPEHIIFIISDVSGAGISAKCTMAMISQLYDFIPKMKREFMARNRKYLGFAVCFECDMPYVSEVICTMFDFVAAFLLIFSCFFILVDFTHFHRYFSLLC